MTQNNPQVPWTDEQWARVNQVIQEEASRARVAATFLPLVGPLPADADFVRAENICTDSDVINDSQVISINDRDTIHLATLQVLLKIRGAQMADPEMTSVLAMFRRAANVLARLEDAVIFYGLSKGKLPADAPGCKLPGKITGWESGLTWRGLFSTGPNDPVVPIGIRMPALPHENPEFLRELGHLLVSKVQDSINQLEDDGHFSPFAVVLGHTFFQAVTTPEKYGLVLPQDRIIPFLGGGSLLRSSLLKKDNGVVVALGGTPVELVVAWDMACDFLQITPDPHSIFRVREKIALRIKETKAIAALVPETDRASSNRSAASKQPRRRSR
jgi:uncharacterized linocin/CFP29 family protein